MGTDNYSRIESDPHLTLRHCRDPLLILLRHVAEATLFVVGPYCTMHRPLMTILIRLIGAIDSILIFYKIDKLAMPCYVLKGARSSPRRPPD